MIDAYRNGEKLAAIAAEFNCSGAAVSQLAKRLRKVVMVLVVASAVYWAQPRRLAPQRRYGRRQCETIRFVNGNVGASRVTTSAWVSGPRPGRILRIQGVRGTRKLGREHDQNSVGSRGAAKLSELHTWEIFQ